MTNFEIDPTNREAALAALTNVWDNGGIVIGTPQLLRLVRDMTRANRTLNLAFLAANADPEGLHIVTRVLLHNDVDWRCRVLVKVRDKADPVEAWQDMTMERWEELRAGFRSALEVHTATHA
jgi:hypothetical protein